MSILPSRLGFGVSGAHGTFLMSSRATCRLVERAFAGGVRVFDTAPAYGAGEAERRLGKALKTLPRDKVFVTTKAGVTSAGLSRRIRDFSPDAIERSVRASLQRLDLDGIDALILHGVSPVELDDGLLARLDTLKSAGAFRHLGVAIRGGEVDSALADGRFALLMAPAHPFIGAEMMNRLRQARAQGLTVIGIEAAGSGPAPVRIPRKPADLYGFVKAMRSGIPPAPRVAMPGALSDALEDGLADCVMMTTASRAHLDDNIAAVNATG